MRIEPLPDPPDIAELRAALATVRVWRSQNFAVESITAITGDVGPKLVALLDEVVDLRWQREQANRALSEEEARYRRDMSSAIDEITALKRQ